MKRALLFLLALGACDAPRTCRKLWIDDELWPIDHVTILSVRGRVLSLRYEQVRMNGEVTRTVSYATRTADNWRCEERQ